MRVFAVSLEGMDEARHTQSDFPHLTVLADEKRGLADAAKLIHAHSAPDGGDTSAPTTILLDRGGTVRWLFRPGNVFGRLTPDEVLAAIDEHLR